MIFNVFYKKYFKNTDKTKKIILKLRNTFCKFVKDDKSKDNESVRDLISGNQGKAKVIK